MKHIVLLSALFLFLSMRNSVAQDSVSVTTTADLTLSADTTVQVDVAAQSYAQKCAGCHTIGGGKLTGPDLLPTRAWPKSDLSAKIKLMEPRVGPLTQEDIDQFVDLLHDSRAQERVHIAQELAAKAVAAKLEPASKSEGQKLFEGTTSLANGGIACITCHTTGAQGGTFGPDLTSLHTRLSKVAMISAIQQTQYKVMSGTYQNHPITAQEAVHLAEYLTSPESMPKSSAEKNVPVLGASLGVIGFLVVVGLYRKRSRNNFSRQRGMA
ncbi:MAG: c-type cytochrome [Calditrichaeota bacterium]|nr:c-type cytochrome [Calditrichota bacterium]